MKFGINSTDYHQRSVARVLLISVVSVCDFVCLSVSDCLSVCQHDNF